MEQEIVQNFVNEGVFHIAFSDGNGIGYLNGTIEEVSVSSVLIRTLDDERVAVLLAHIIRLEPYRSKMRGDG